MRVAKNSGLKENLAIMEKWILPILMLLALTPSSFTWAGTSDSSKPYSLSVLLNSDDQPYSYFNSQGEARGMLADYWRLWAKHSGIQVNLLDSQHGWSSSEMGQAQIYGSQFEVRFQPGIWISEPLLTLTPELLYFPEHKQRVMDAVHRQAGRLRIGGLLSKYERSSVLKISPDIEYIHYHGVLELTLDLAAGELDAIVLQSQLGFYQTISRLLRLHLETVRVNGLNTQVFALVKDPQILTWVNDGNKLISLAHREMLGREFMAGFPVLNNKWLPNLGLVFSAVLFLVLLLLLYRQRKNSKQFKCLLDASPYPLAMVGLKNADLYYANDEAASLLGLIGNKRKHRFANEQLRQQLAEFFDGFSHRPMIEDERLQLADTSGVGQVILSAKRLHYKGKSAWLCHFKDVTSQLTAESDLQQERALLRKVLDAIPEYICFKDKAGKIIGCNQAWAEFHGMTVAGVSGKRESDIYSREELSRAKNTEAQVWAGSNYQTTEWVTHTSGKQLLLQVSKYPLSNSEDETFGVLTVSHDVTDWHFLNKKLEEENEQRVITEKELAKQNSLLTSVFKASPDPIGFLNHEGFFIGGNEPFAHSMGTDVKSMLGRHQKEILSDEKLEWSESQDREIIESGETIKFEELVFTEGGVQTWYEVHKSPFYDESTDDSGIVVMARDVTERKETEQQLADAIMELEELSFVDSLTKVSNRRSFDEKLKQHWLSSRREEISLSLILCDIDYFKPYNDNYGHQKGDLALQQVAAIISQAAKRATDLVARYGGEEFAILLPSTDREGACVIAEEVRRAVDRGGIVHEHSAITDHVTLSLGVATMIPVSDADYGDLLQQADKALYRAKNGGRNNFRHYLAPTGN